MTDAEKILHDEFVHYGRNAKEWMRKCVLLLPKIHQRAIWRKRGFSSLYEYAARLAGMSRHTVDDALRILRKIADKPALQKIVRERGIHAVRPVVTIATSETETFWAKKANEMSKNTLETYVREWKKQEGRDFKEDDVRANAETNQMNSRPRTAISPDTTTHINTTTEETTTGRVKNESIKTITMHLEPAVAEELEKLKGSDDWNALMKEFLALRKEASKREKPQAVQTPSRHIPAHIKQFVVNKTRGQCAYPGCVKPYHILHHTERWALKNVHNPDTLVPLCKAHERIAHHGLIKHEEKQTEEWGILEEPTWWDIKRIVDERVMEYRNASKFH